MSRLVFTRCRRGGAACAVAAAAVAIAGCGGGAAHTAAGSPTAKVAQAPAADPMVPAGVGTATPGGAAAVDASASASGSGSVSGSQGVSLTKAELAFCTDWSTPAGLLGQPASFWKRLEGEAPAPLRADVVKIAQDTAAGSPYASELITPSSAVFGWVGADCPQ